MRKSQIQSQVFIYILALIVMSFILIYGYNSIKSIRDKEELVSLINFQTDIQKSISRISNDYGSIKTEKIFVPTGFQEVCFVELSTANPIDDVKEEYPIIWDYVDSIINNNAEEKNVFLIPSGTESVYVGDIEVDPDFLCFKVSNGRINIKLEGLGNKAKISVI